MKSLLLAIALPLGLALAAASHAQAPAGAPAGSTGACKDGSYTDAASKKGACRGHKGVKEWYAADAGAAAKSDAAETKASRRASSASAPMAASAPAGAAPAGSTGLCRDGSYTNADSKKGACRGHKGVQEWYAAAAAAPTAAPAPKTAPMTPAAPAPSVAPAPMAIPASTAAPATTSHRMPPNPATRTAAPGGGAGQVWFNEETRVFHCAGDEWYGKTRKGQYMTEAAATAAGGHPAHGKACSAQ